MIRKAYDFVPPRRFIIIGKGEDWKRPAAGSGHQPERPGEAGRVKVAVLTFSSTHAALRAEKCLKDKGVAGDLVPAPREITASCGLAWLGPRDAVEEAQALLAACGVEAEGLHVLAPEAARRWAWLLAAKEGERDGEA